MSIALDWKLANGWLPDPSDPRTVEILSAFHLTTKDFPAPDRTEVSDDAERALIGAVIIAGHLTPITRRLKPDLFRRPEHQWTWARILEMELAKVPIDLVSLSARLDAAVSSHYLAYLTDLVPSVDSMDEYADIVRDAAIGRKHASKAPRA